jgi:hypothetical protein
LAANKSDLFDKEQVSEAEAREYAKEIGAVFKLTSASSGTGIEEIFKSIGYKFLDPNFKEDEEGGKRVKPTNDNEGRIRIDEKNTKPAPKKKSFC